MTDLFRGAVAMRFHTVHSISNYSDPLGGVVERRVETFFSKTFGLFGTCGARRR